MNRSLVSFLLLFILSPLVQAQDSSRVNWLISFGYGYQITGADLNHRYGSHGVLSLEAIKKIKSWELGMSYDYFFGSIVKEDVLAPLRTPEGDFIGSDHQLVQVDFRMRGTAIGILINKELKKINTPHAIILGLKPVWLMHWIRFQSSGTLESINGNYRYGYDRFSSGMGLGTQIGYRYLSKNKLINFEFALHSLHANTLLRRNIQLDKPGLGHSKTSDALYGISAKWIVPIYSKANPDKIFYY